MAVGHRAATIVCVTLLAGALALGTAGCAASGAARTDAPQSNQQHADDQQSGDPQGRSTQAPSDQSTSGDGAADPVQQTRRADLAVGFGGPSNGDQGVAVDGDVLCQGVSLFWQPEAPPGLSFTVTSVALDPALFEVRATPCGGFTQSCDTVKLDFDASAQCSVAFLPRVADAPPTPLTITGEFDCTDAVSCAAMTAYKPETTAPLVVCDDGDDCAIPAAQDG